MINKCAKCEREVKFPREDGLCSTCRSKKNNAIRNKELRSSPYIKEFLPFDASLWKKEKVSK